MKRLLVISRVNRRNLAIAGLAAIALLATGLAYLTSGTGGGEGACPQSEVLYWYDPMLPAERYPGPGTSSMGMELVPKCADEGTQGGVTVSPAMQQSLGIRLARVETRDIAPTVNAVGQVQFDDRLISEVQTLTPGFVETLAVRAEGEPIAAGRVVAQVYSPELLGAQNEYKALLAARSSSVASLRSAARSRLKLLGAPESLVSRLERGGAPQRTYPVVARTSGVVTEIGVRPGAQVAVGQSIITIQGLSRVLVVADVPEASLANIHVGQPAQISFPAYPGDVREGVIDYIYPAFNPQTRTARVRITISNPALRLKQGMFANLTLQGAGGMAVVVPSEALIDTGRRQVVIVKRNGAFIPQEVRVGRDYQDWTEIVAGVRPGEEIVASGQFLIDSEASLSGVIARLQTNQPPAPETASGTGMITAVHVVRGSVTISHGPIGKLHWPAMTMEFKLARPGMARGLRKGMRVEFVVKREPNGTGYVIEQIIPEGTR